MEPADVTRKPEGFLGKKNIYVCDTCFEHIVTVVVDEGTTPFMTTCQATEGCRGLMQSSFYQVFDQRMKASHEWYRPPELEWSQHSPAVRHHLELGGLLLRERKI